MKIIVKSTKTISFDESESSGSDVTDDKSEKPRNSVVIEETASDHESSNDDVKRPLKQNSSSLSKQSRQDSKLNITPDPQQQPIRLNPQIFADTTKKAPRRPSSDQNSTPAFAEQSPDKDSMGGLQHQYLYNQSYQQHSGRKQDQNKQQN
jgi:hypothetical protein